MSNDIAQLSNPLFYIITFRSLHTKKLLILSQASGIKKLTFSNVCYCEISKAALSKKCYLELPIAIYVLQLPNWFHVLQFQSLENIYVLEVQLQSKLF